MAVAMLNSRKSLQDQSLEVVKNIEEALSHTIPDLAHDKRAFCYEFAIHIRDGRVNQVDTDTWDESFKEVPITDPQSIDIGLKKLLSWLLRDLTQRTQQGYHGMVFLRVSVKQAELSFSTLVRRQRRYN